MNSMLYDNLFEESLIKPIQNGGNNLYIISGYATSAMAFHHLNKIKELNSRVEVELVVGMCAQDGISETNHKGFKKIIEEDFKDNFKCGYVFNRPPVHAKVYSWFKDDEPLIGFIGSANYTQTAFYEKQKNVLVEYPATKCFDYFQMINSDSIYCNHIDADNLVQIYKDNSSRRIRRRQESIKDREGEPIRDESLCELPHKKISFLDKNGNLPQRSGLNWGQRPEEGRDPDQAYIRLPSVIYRSDFFPERGIHFTVNTDDDKLLICSRAQENGKAIHTPHNNSLIGQYFRNRLGLSQGQAVTKEHLAQYGRVDVDFYKIDEETYYMDFSKP